MDDPTRHEDDDARGAPRPKAGRSQSKHLMRFFPADYLTSPLRTALAVEGDDVARLAYLELLLALHANDGAIRRADVPGAVALPREKAEKALERLLESGRIVEDDGWISNPRVTSQLEQDREFSEAQARRGRLGAEARAASAKRTPSERRAVAKRALAERLAASAVAVASASASAGADAVGQAELTLVSSSVPARVASRLTAIINAATGRRLGRNRALEEAVEKALAAGYPEDEIVGALWGGLCGPDGWWRTEGKGNADPMLLLRFRGGVNPTTGQPARQWLPELLARLPEVYPQYVRDAVAKLETAGLGAEVDWLRERNVRGAS